MIWRSIFLFLLFPLTAWNQASFQIQYSQLDSASSLQTFDATQLPDGRYAITGLASKGSSSTLSSPFIALLDCTGKVQWMKTFGSTQSIGNVYPKVIVTKDTHLVIINNVGSYQNYSGLAAKLDLQGTLLWQKRLNLSSSSDNVNDIIETINGELILTGSNQTTSDVSIIKLSSNGDLIWHKSYGNSGQYDDGYALMQTLDGGYMVTGRYISMGTFNALLLKTDSAGSLQWLKCYGDSNQHTVGYDIKQLSNGDIVMVGSTTLLKPNFQSYSDNFIMRLNAAGDTLWNRIFYGTPDLFENISSVEIDTQGNLLLGVATASYATTGFVPNKNAVMKFSGSGNLMFARLYHVGSSHYTRISTCGDGTILLTAFSNAYASPIGFQTLLMKMNAHYETGCFETDVLSQTVVSGGLFKITLPSYNSTSGATLTADNSNQFSPLNDSILCTYTPPLVASVQYTGNCAGSVTSFSIQSNNATQFVWDFGDSTTLSSNSLTATHSYSNAGTYTLTLRFSNGCQQDSLTEVMNISSPIPALHIGNDTIICEGQSIQLEVNVTGFPIVWSNASTSNLITVNQAGIYSVEINTGVCGVIRDSIQVSTKSCTVTDEFCGLFMPNAFSPNGDGNNENIHPLLKNGSNIVFQSLEIRNRWGNLAFNSTDINRIWDGKIQGKNAESDTYYYFIRYKCNGEDKVMKGDILLVR